MTHWITAALGVSVGAVIIYCVRKDRLMVRHGLGWFLAALLLILVGLFPRIVDQVAVWADVAYPPTLAIVIGFTALVCKALLSDIELSRSEVKLNRLVQRLAILELSIMELKSESKNP